MFSIEVTFNGLSIINFGDILVSNSKEFFLAREIIGFILLYTFPLTKSFRLEMIHLDWPIPRHFDKFAHGLELIIISICVRTLLITSICVMMSLITRICVRILLIKSIQIPMNRKSSALGPQPPFALIGPKLFPFIALLHDKIQVLSIRDLIFGNLKRLNFRRGITHFVVKQVHVRVTFVIFPLEIVGIYAYH